MSESLHFHIITLTIEELFDTFCILIFQYGQQPGYGAPPPAGYPVPGAQPGYPGAPPPGQMGYGMQPAGGILLHNVVYN